MGEGIGYANLPWQPVIPPQPTVGISHLLSMLIAGLRMGAPHIKTFTGDSIPRNTKVSFKQCYYEVQCIKDHYPEVVAQESIIWLLKGAATDMVQYMGLTASIDHIL